MQIHELPTASPSGSDYIAIDDGDSTRKATLSSVDMAQNQVTFTSGDKASPSNWQTVAVLASNTLSNLMGAISKMIANVRWLYNRIGTTSMGTTAETLTGAIAEVTESVNANTSDIAELNGNLEVQAFNITSYDSSVLALNRQHCYKYGKRVVLSFDCTATQAVSNATGAKFVSIPDEYKPTTDTPPRASIININGNVYTALAKIIMDSDHAYVGQSATSTIASGARVSIYMEYCIV